MRNKVDISLRLYQHKVNSLLKLAWVSTSAAAMAALIILVVYWYTPAKNTVFIWFVIYAGFYLFRTLVNRSFNHKPAEQKNYQFIYKFHLACSIVSGSLWAAVTIYLLSIFSSYDTLYILLILGGLVAGAMATNNIFMSAFFAFVLPATIPVVIYLVFQDNPQLTSFSVIISIFLAFITSAASRLNRLVNESISQHFNYLQLLEDLEHEKNHVTELYSNLEYDLAARKETEEKLKIEKQRAEELAESLIEISSLDGLTGIANRRNFDSTLAKEWNRAGRTGTPISLVMCDIDFFKSYNDHYGHQKGDNCLIQIATVLREHARRDDDLAARYGGEEFAIILPATNLENARELAEQMRTAIIELCIPHRFSKTDNIVTASFGVATMVPKRDQPSKLLLLRADKALYTAKRQGRNQVVDLPLEIHVGEDFEKVSENGG